MLEVLVVALHSPLYVGVYRDGRLIERFETQQQSSEALPEIFETIVSRYTIDGLYYANGPGSFMAIKVAYVFLKTLSIAMGVPLRAADAFRFNANRPVKAVGKLYFVKTSDTIETRRFETPPAGGFALPEHLVSNDFSDETLPLYGIGAVG